MSFDLIVNIILVTIGFSLVGTLFYHLWFEENNEKEEEVHDEVGKDNDTDDVEVHHSANDNNFGGNYYAPKKEEQTYTTFISENALIFGRLAETKRENNRFFGDPNKRIDIGTVITKEGLELTLTSKRDKQDYDLTNFGARELEENIDKVYIREDIKEVSNLTTIRCHDQPLSYIYLPEGIEFLNCVRSGIKELELPKGIKSVECSPSTEIKNLYEVLNDPDNVEPNIEFIHPDEENRGRRNGGLDHWDLIDI